MGGDTDAFADLDGAPNNAVHPLTRGAWRVWLSEHHETADNVWFVYYKKATGKPVVTYDESVEEALCFGWVDSLPRKLDDERSMLYFAPRKSGSNWSRLNKERIARLEAEGKMSASGSVLVEQAKRDKSWNALDDVEDLIVPDDLAAALADAPPARAHWDAFPPSTRKGILEWILNAKRPTTRQKRIDETTRLAQQNKRANQWPREG